MELRCVIACAVTMCFSVEGTAVAAPITINNHSFEQPVLAEAGISLSADSWVGAGAFNPGPPNQYASSNPPGLDGANSGFLFETATGLHMRQTLSATLQANTAYTFTAAIGNRDGASPNFWFGGYRMRLIAGFGSGDFIVLDSGDVSTNPAPSGQFVDVTLVGTTGPTPPGVGLPLTVVFEAVDPNGPATTYLDVDNVRLDASFPPVPVDQRTWTAIKNLYGD